MDLKLTPTTKVEHPITSQTVSVDQRMIPVLPFLHSMSQEMLPGTQTTKFITCYRFAKASSFSGVMPWFLVQPTPQVIACIQKQYSALFHSFELSHPDA